jgi:hypothetical protein
MINSCVTLRSQGACASTSCRSSRLNVWAKAAAERTGTSASTVRILRYPNGQVLKLYAHVEVTSCFDTYVRLFQSTLSLSLLLVLVHETCSGSFVRFGTTLILGPCKLQLFKLCC